MKEGEEKNKKKVISLKTFISDPWKTLEKAYQDDFELLQNISKSLQALDKETSSA